MKKKEIFRYVRDLAIAAVRNLEDDPKLAELQARLAKKIRLKSRVKQPYELKILFCKKCKGFAPPPLFSKIRIKKGWLEFRCLRCGKVYRKKVKFKTSRKGLDRLR